MIRKSGTATPMGADPDAGKGAVEGDRPDEPQDFNADAALLDENGLPANMEPICEDVIGANVDTLTREAGVANAAVGATETGKTPAGEDERHGSGGSSLLRTTNLSANRP